MLRFSFNIRSAALWSSLSGAAGIVCGALGLGHLAPSIEAVLTAVGGLLIAIPAHHVISKQQTTSGKVA